MSDKFDLYNHAYRGHESEVNRQIRLATYGRDFGQSSWVTTEESDAIPRFLQISASSEVLEIGFGSGLYAIHLAKTTGCRITGVEINTHAVATATELARQSSLEALVTFQQHDVSERLPFESNRFHAAFSNDVVCHVPDRLLLLQELRRVLRPAGQLLFSDALVIGGLVTNEELAIRSSIGLYVFAAPGENEKLLEEAGFEIGGRYGHDIQRRFDRRTLAYRERGTYRSIDRDRRRGKLRRATAVLKLRLAPDTRESSAAVCLPSRKKGLAARCGSLWCLGTVGRATWAGN